MQNDFDALDQPVQIIGINGIDLESGNEMMTSGRDLPWLQDTIEVDAWNLWQVEYRDVYILDQEGQLRFIYNLTEHNLANSTNYQELIHAINGLLNPVE